MSHSSNTALLNVMSAAATKAGRGLVRDFGEVTQLQISRKGPANFVTASDVRTEKLLRTELKKARPGYGFLLEEGGEIAGSDPEFRWVIDPLDGTTNFIHAVPYFCISIALERRISDKASEVVGAVVYDPIHNDLFVAEKNRGAFVNGRRMQVSARTQPDEYLLITGAPRSNKPGYKESLAMIQAVTDTSAGVRFLGAAALDLAYVAAGRVDGFWHSHLQRWDIAAGALLVREAGGEVSTVSDTRDMLDCGEILATNGKIHAKLRGLLRGATAQK